MEEHGLPWRKDQILSGPWSEARTRQHLTRYRDGIEVDPPDWLKPTIARLQQYFAGEKVDFAGVPLDLLAVDPETFADAAFWEASFSSRSLQELMDDISEPIGIEVPALLVGIHVFGATVLWSITVALVLRTLPMRRGAHAKQPTAVAAALSMSDSTQSS